MSSEHAAAVAAGSIFPVVSYTQLWQDLTPGQELFFWIQLQPCAPPVILPQGWLQKTESSVWTPAFYLLAPSHADPFRPQHASSLVSPFFLLL